jgi:magnesium transporter
MPVENDSDITPVEPEATATKPRLEEFMHALNEGTLFQIRHMLDEMPGPDIADVLESMPRKERYIVWALVDSDSQGEILTFLNDSVRGNLIRRMDLNDLAQATIGMDTDDVVDILQHLPSENLPQILQNMNEQERGLLESALAYPGNTAGGLMNTDALTLRPDVTVDVANRYLRWRASVPQTTEHLVVVDREGHYLGVVTLSDLLTQPVDRTIESIMGTELEPILANTDEKEVARRFERERLVTAPVVDNDGLLVGRITVDDIIDVLREEAEHEFLSMAGLGEQLDTFSPIIHSARRRAVWLGTNLVTAFIAAAVIGLFEATISVYVALAVLMPIVASMGGIGGSQTLTLVIRAMALGQISDANLRFLIRKELSVAAINGGLWATLVSIVVYFWFKDFSLSLILGISLLLNMVMGALSGLYLPIFMRRVGIDPALAGSVVLTTVTDVVGFFCFLGLASLLLVP